MKIALIGDSPLLDKSLEMFLKDYLTSYKQCDFIVTTKPLQNAHKPVFLVQKPFTKEILLQNLESFYAQIKEKEKMQQKITPLRDSSQNIQEQNLQNAQEINLQDTNQENKEQILEAKIKALFLNYAKDLEALIKSHYNV